MPANRRSIRDAADLAALNHPLRLDLITHLMAVGQATASACARAVGDSPSNCSYHLRVLQRSGLVQEASSGDGRERPWRAIITGFDVQPDLAGDDPAAALIALAVQRDHRLTVDYLARRPSVDPVWHAADGHATYTLRMTPDELAALGAQLDALIRPYLAATRQTAPAGGGLVHIGLHAFPLPEQ